MSTRYKNGTDFRKSLEARLMNRARQSGEDIQRLRRKVAFDRFLARIFHRDRSGFVLKGGYAMELRLSNARATKDMDLTCLSRFTAEKVAIENLLLEDLRQLARINLRDFFSFRVGEAKMDLEAAPYGGARYPVSAYMDGRLFTGFQLDVGIDTIVNEVERITAYDWLSFCDIAAPEISMVAIEQQFAEKLHAYTLPRSDRVNMRTKDLVDMVLLVKMRALDADKFSEALKQVFALRDTHPLPISIPPPPQQWEKIYQGQAADCGLSHSLLEAYEEIVQWCLPILEQI